MTENPAAYSQGCGVNDHAIAMLGVMGSKSGYYGFAYGSSYAVSGMCSNSVTNPSSFNSELQQGISWLVDNQGARVINASFGSPLIVNGAYSSDLTQTDLYFDRVGYTGRVTLVTSAGQAQNGYLDSPAKAYNVIAVGALDDKGTTDDNDGVMWSASSWRNPTSYHNDRQKPEIVAPGVGPLYSATRFQQTTTPGGSICWECSYFANIGSGTSVSAAFISGMVGQMMGRDARLKFQPEAVKAILLTAATEKTPSGPEYEGAGGVFADYADNMAQGYVSGLDASAAMAAGAKGGWLVINDFCTKYPPWSTVKINLGVFPANTDIHATMVWGGES